MYFNFSVVAAKNYGRKLNYHAKAQRLKPRRQENFGSLLLGVLA